MLRKLNVFLEGQAYNLIKKVNTDYLEGALKLGGDLIAHVVREAYNAIPSGPWPTLNELTTFVTGLIDLVIVPFRYLILTVQSFEVLEAKAFQFGGYLIGRVAQKLGVGTLTDDAVEGLARIGKDMQDVVFDLSDEATEGVGEAVGVLGEKKVRNVFSQCFVDLTSFRFNKSKPVAGLASPLLTLQLCDDALKVFNDLGDDSAKRGADKLTDNPVFHQDFEMLLLRYVDEGSANREHLRDFLGIIDEAEYDLFDPAEWNILENLVKIEVMSKDALKHLPLNTLKSTFEGVPIHYQNFDAYLEHSAYLGTHRGLIDNLAQNDQVEALNGHLSQVLGEYRERRYISKIKTENQDLLHSHLNPSNVADPLTGGDLPANAPGIDALSKKGDTYIIGEVKDRGLGYGTINDGISGNRSGNRLNVEEFEKYFGTAKIPGTNLYGFQGESFLIELRAIFSNNPTQVDAIINAAKTGKLELHIFAGGRDTPFVKGLPRKLLNPYTETGKPYITVEYFTDKIYTP